MTKLKKPITITIEHIENAVSIMLSEDFLVTAEFEPRHKRINKAMAEGEMSDQIKAQLTAQGIDYLTWGPTPPLLIGNHEVEALPDGAIKVGSTMVDRATLEKVYAMSNDSMTKVEPEWPRYYEHKGPYAMWKAYSETEVVEVESGGKECSSSAGCLPSLEDSANKGTRKRYTTAQAAAILKGAK